MSKKKKRVTIISRESDEKSIDIAMLEEELRSRGLQVSVLCRLFAKDKPLKALGYTAHILRQELDILRSDVVVLDTYCIAASMLPHRRGTKIIQMWHALAAIKKFGWQTVGTPGGSSERTARLMKMHRGYDYVLSASEITAGHFCEAFRASEDKIVRLGLPRIDYIKSVAQGSRREETAKRIYEAYPELWSGADRGNKILRLAALAQDDNNGALSTQDDNICHPEEHSDEESFAPRENSGDLRAQDDNSGFALTQDDNKCHSEEQSDEESFALRESKAIPQKDKKIILYAPTFRKGREVNVQSLIDAIDSNRYNIVVKLHPVYGKILRLAALAQDDNNGALPTQDDNICHSEEQSDEESFAPRESNAIPQKEKKTILYAPTFRKGREVNVQSLIDAIDSDRYNIVVKLHPVYGKILRLAALAQDDNSGAAFTQEGGGVIFDGAFSSYDWLSVADIVVSDYSSFVVEAALAEKPLYIYAYDMKEYEKSTGLNMNFDTEEIAKYTFQSAAELAQALDTDYDFAALSRFRSKYIDVDTENCTEALADFIETLMV